MKLFSRYNRLNIAATITIFVIGSITYYFLLYYVLMHQVDESLEIEHQEIIEHVEKDGTLPEILPTNDQFITITPANAATPSTFKNIHAIYPETHDEWYREMLFTIPVAGKFYTVSIRKSLEETESLLQIIIVVTVVMVALILITGYIINRLVVNKLWRPFYATIDKIKTYNIAEKESIEFSPTNIDELDLLNNTLSQMTERTRKDFQSLKEFTGYAAHEMQTPLSIIRIRLDMLIQSTAFSHDGAQGITDIEKAVHKLSRLYQSLLLLTKVENRAFVLDEDVHLDKLILDKYSEFSAMIEAKDIDIQIHATPLTIKFHQQLAEILVGNLLSNAIRYNVQHGSINVRLQEGTLTIANTSDLPPLTPEHLYQRFYRHSDVKAEGNGLGLSIIKQICDMAGYSITYIYADEMHTFIIKFA